MRNLISFMAIAMLVAGVAYADKEFDPEPTPGIRVGDPGPDAFGYIRTNVPAGWVLLDISGSGTFIVTGDDSWASYNLSAPFDFYGVNYNAIAPSTNGGASFDNTYVNLGNVCPLPDNQMAIFLFNDDLRTDVSGGGVYGQYFEICPFDGDAGVEPCTVIMWDEAYHYGGSSTASWDMEIVLFHNSNNIGMLFDDRFNNDGSGTTGIDQGTSDVNWCLTVACNAASAPVAGTQYLIVHPTAVPNEKISFGALKSIYR